MENIFDTNNLYPGYELPLKQHFKEYFDSVFISFSPFFQLIDNNEEGFEISSTKIISLKELQKKDAIFKNIQPHDSRVIYTNDNLNYPVDDKIINKGSVVTWRYILENTDFENLKDISLALRTSIGALTKDFETKQLLDILNNFTTKNAIYQPREGRITILSLIKIYNCLTAIGKVELVITDEFFDDRKKLDLSKLTCSEFVLQARGYMYFFSIDRFLLFTIEWDSFFFLICGDQKTLYSITPEFEGFFCTDTTIHNWDF